MRKEIKFLFIVIATVLLLGLIAYLIYLFGFVDARFRGYQFYGIWDYVSLGLYCVLIIELYYLGLKK